MARRLHPWWETPLVIVKLMAGITLIWAWLLVLVRVTEAVLH